MLARTLAASLLLTVGSANAADSSFTQNDARDIIRQLQKVVTPHGVDKQIELTIGGGKQWLTIRGHDLNNPILLFVHGGPAAPEMPTSWTFQSPWEEYFTVVQWDQRGAGKSYGSNDPIQIAPTLSTEAMEHDLEEVVQYLRITYAKDKIFVMGHSWGSTLGLMLAKRHPEWLYAYIGMGQMIDTRASEKESYDAMLTEAQRTGNAQAISELESIAPYPGERGLLLENVNIERKWVMKFGGLTLNRDNYSYYYKAAELSPDYTDADVAGIDKGSQLSLKALVADFAQVDFTKTLNFRCPIVIFNGRHDETVSSNVTAAWFVKVHAPMKKMVWFENSAHMMQIEEPGHMLLHLVEDVRPLAAVDFTSTASSHR